MIKQIQVNATNARKNLFKLIDQVANNNVSILITKEGLSTSVVISKQNTSTSPFSLQKQLLLVKNTTGSIKTTGYKPTETDLAKRHFTKNYKKTNQK